MKVIGLYSVLKSGEDPFRNWRNAATLNNNEFFGKYFFDYMFSERTVNGRVKRFKVPVSMVLLLSICIVKILKKL